MLEIYGLKSCDTCRKATKMLEAAGHSVKFIDVRSGGVPSDLLSAWIHEHGVATMVNMRSTTWRGLQEEDRGRVDTEAGAVALLTEYPSLMKRPVIVDSGKVTIGWSKDVQAALL